MDYIELNVRLKPREPFAEILVAQLAEIGFESFEDTREGLKAYIPKDLYKRDKVNSASFIGDSGLEVEIEVEENIIPHQNWNALWESDFKPVFVEDKLSIIAPFHDPTIAKGMHIIIQPQMSFGTGHHQTTWMVSKMMLEMDEIPESVLDMGAGTGILAILAEKRGAKNILAIDIEPWSAENIAENAQRNDCKYIEAVCGDIDLIEGKTFGLILANINKNILKAHMKSYANALDKLGKLILSGFFDSDTDELLSCAAEFGLSLEKKITKETWAALLLTK